jgi:hypothetical protein
MMCLVSRSITQGRRAGIVSLAVELATDRTATTA